SRGAGVAADAARRDGGPGSWTVLPGKTKRHGLIGPCRSVSGNRGGGDGNRTRVQGFAGPCLSHSATPPQGACRKGIRTSESGRRDSNPRPSPWQGDALPTEPRPHRTLGVRSEL